MLAVCCMFSGGRGGKKRVSWKCQAMRNGRNQKKKRLLGLFSILMFLWRWETVHWYGSSAITDKITTKSTTSASNQPGLFETDFLSFYPWLMMAFKKYKSICQLSNHVAILIKTTGILATPFKHCLWVFSTRHLRWLSCKSQAGRADEIVTTWVDDNVGLQEFLSLSLSLPFRIRQSPLLAYVSFYTHRCLSERETGRKNVCSICLRYPRLPNECALGPCRRRKSWSNRLE